MNFDHIDNRNFYGKQISEPTELSVATKLEFFDEGQRYSRSRVIRVDFSGEGVKQMFVKRSLPDERCPPDSTAL